MGGDPGNSDETVTVICAPYSLQALMQVPGNVVRRCASCRRQIVASPHALDQGDRLICFACAQEENPGPTHGVLPGAVTDAADLLGVPREVMERSAERMKSMPLVELDLFPEDEPPERKP